MNHEDVVIVAAARTPQGRLKGQLASLTAVQLGSTAIRGALEKGGIPADAVDAVLVGQVLAAGAGQNPARQAAVGAGIPWTVHSGSVNKVCLSGLTAIIDGARMIADRRREGRRRRRHGVHDARRRTCSWAHATAGRTARSRCSTTWRTTGSPTRTTARAWARRPSGTTLRSTSPARSRMLSPHARISAPPRPPRPASSTPRSCRSRSRSARATRSSSRRMKASAPTRPSRRSRDFARRSPRAARSRPATRRRSRMAHRPSCSRPAPTRTRTAGRCSPWSAPPVRWPVPTTRCTPSRRARSRRRCAKQGITPADLDLVEINEAFGAVVARSQAELGLSDDVVNPHGGGIAIGHPIGASGNRLVVHAVHELVRRGSGTAAVALCGGGGQGDALILTR